MKKLKSIVIAISLFFLTACSATDLNNFLSDLNKNISQVTNTTGSDYTNGKHYHYIKLPGNSYYSTSELELYTDYSLSYDKTHYDLRILLSGKIFSKVNAPLTAVVYFPIYNSDGVIMRKITRDYTAEPYDAIDIDLTEEHYYTNRKYFLNKDHVVIAIYCQGKLVGTNHPELFETKKTETKTTSKSAETTTKKSKQNKVVKQQKQKVTTTENKGQKRTRQSL